MAPKTAKHALLSLHVSTSLLQHGFLVFEGIRCKCYDFPHLPSRVDTQHHSVCHVALTMSDSEELLDLISLTQDERIQLALEAIAASGMHANGWTELSTRQAATAFNVPRSTLQDRYNG